MLNTATKSFDLTPEQNQSLQMLRSGENIFLTGGAGSGKSFLIRHYMKELSSKEMPILASTGAAAVLIGGRTFHSFFGLGIMEGGAAATVTRGMKDARLMARLRKVEGVIIDEVSMISGEAMAVAERLAREARQSQHPWGGMRVLAVGDFAQLPPVTRGSTQKDWCFLNEVWERSGFQTTALSHNQRVSDNEFLNVLSEVRYGQVNQQVRDFLNDRIKIHDEDHPAMRLFPRKIQSEDFNQKRLSEINAEEFCIDSIYLGSEKHIESLRKNSPVPSRLIVKEGCRVMFLQNDPQKRWINGTRGVVTSIEADKIRVRKESLHGKNDPLSLGSLGREVQVEKTTFSLQDAEGNVVASVIQFPLILAYATTIHKSQGATLDDLWCDLSALWEPGHAYVALSRLRSPDGLHLIQWSPRSIIVDPRVIQFYSQFG